jgi:hypothetical protein
MFKSVVMIMMIIVMVKLMMIMSMMMKWCDRTYRIRALYLEPLEVVHLLPVSKCLRH